MTYLEYLHKLGWCDDDVDRMKGLFKYLGKDINAECSEDFEPKVEDYSFSIDGETYYIVYTPYEHYKYVKDPKVTEKVDDLLAETPHLARQYIDVLGLKLDILEYYIDECGFEQIVLDEDTEYYIKEEK